MKIKVPFMWKHISDIPQIKSATAGEERPLTASAYEENSPSVIEIVEN